MARGALAAAGPTIRPRAAIGCERPASDASGGRADNIAAVGICRRWPYTRRESYRVLSLDRKKANEMIRLARARIAGQTRFHVSFSGVIYQMSECAKHRLTRTCARSGVTAR